MNYSLPSAYITESQFSSYLLVEEWSKFLDNLGGQSPLDTEVPGPTQCQRRILPSNVSAQAKWCFEIRGALARKKPSSQHHVYILGGCLKNSANTVANHT